VSWDYSFTERALKQLKKLDRTAQQKILEWLDKRIEGRTFGAMAFSSWGLPNHLPATR